MSTPTERSGPRATSERAPPSSGARGERNIRIRAAAPPAATNDGEQRALQRAQEIRSAFLAAVAEESNGMEGVRSENPQAAASNRGDPSDEIRPALGPVPRLTAPTPHPAAQSNRSVERGASNGPAGGVAMIGVEVPRVGARGPVEGRVERRRVFWASGRAIRTGRPTSSQRRYRASRPRGQHPQVSTCDLLPLDKRFSLAGQERSIFRSRGLLVSRFDFTLYYALLETSARELAKVFPKPPIWWPGDWGNIPITLPMEASLFRADLVSAKDEAAVWRELYQLFLEQLAGGWDLWFHSIAEGGSMMPIPTALASDMLKYGAFSFCPSHSPSLATFLEVHQVQGGAPDQRRAKADAWERIEKRKREEELDRAGTTKGCCECAQKHERAVRRLGVEALVAEASESERLERISGSSEKLAALAAACLRFAIDADGTIGRIRDIVTPTAEESYDSHMAYRAHGEVRNFRSLSEFLPSRVGSMLTRLG